MAFTFARVDSETLEVILKYNTNGGAKWADGDIECLIPFDVLADQAVRDSEGTVTLVEDPAKVSARTQRLWSDLRAERNRRLAASDWTQLGDAHMSQDRKEAWAQYRQELRDLPDAVQITSPEDLVSVPWPSDPTVPVPIQSTGSRLDNLLGQV